MLTVSAQELASIQAEAVSAVCSETCSIYRPPVASSSRGSTGEQVKPASSYTHIVDTVCGVSEPTSGELANYDFLIATKIALKVRFPYGTNVQEQDHIQLENQTLEVHVLLTPRSYPAFVSVIAAELK